MFKLFCAFMQEHSNSANTKTLTNEAALVTETPGSTETPLPSPHAVGMFHACCWWLGKTYDHSRLHVCTHEAT